MQCSAFVDRCNDKISSSRGRRPCYEALVEKFYHDVFRYACWLCKSRPLAEDLVQETFLRAWRSMDGLENKAAAKRWLFVILKREHARLCAKGNPRIDDIDDYSLAQDPAGEPDSLLERDMLYTAIGELKPAYSEPLALQVIGGFSTEEIGRMLGLNKNTVALRLFRARNTLMQKLA